jgi:hypothetical protein
MGKEMDAELVVEDKPDTKAIVGLATIVIKNTDIANNKDNLFGQQYKNIYIFSL